MQLASFEIFRTPTSVILQLNGGKYKVNREVKFVDIDDSDNPRLYMMRQVDLLFLYWEAEFGRISEESKDNVIKAIFED